jgi:hypothetical protein
MTLEELLRSHPNGRFCLKTQGIDPDAVHIIIHPDGEDGTTLDFLVTANILRPLLEQSFIGDYQADQ